MSRTEPTKKSDLWEGLALLIGAPILLVAAFVAQLYGVFSWAALGLAVWFGVTIGLAMLDDHLRVPRMIMVLAGPVLAIAVLVMVHGFIHPHFSWSNAWAFLCGFGVSSAC